MNLEGMRLLGERRRLDDKSLRFIQVSAGVKDKETLSFHNSTIRVLHGYTSGKAFTINTEKFKNVDRFKKNEFSIHELEI